MNNPPLSLFIGVTGENDYRKIEFDLSDWRREFPEGAVSVVFRRPDGEVYPVEAGVTENTAVWTVSDVDVAAAGNGMVELCMACGDIIAKSRAIRTVTRQGAGAAGDPPAPPAPDWVTEVTSAAYRVSLYAQSAIAAKNAAEVAVSHYPYVGGNGDWFVWDAAAGEFADTGVSAFGGDAALLNGDEVSY